MYFLIQILTNEYGPFLASVELTLFGLPKDSMQQVTLLHYLFSYSLLVSNVKSIFAVFKLWMILFRLFKP